MTPFAPLDDNLDYQDVKLKIVQQEGYDAHDFNLFDDRASQLWRKPYVDGAVQELTSNDNRSADQLRVAVEQMMLAAGNQNPDVRLTGSAAPKSGATVKVDAQIDNEEDVLRDMRAIRLGPSPRPIQKHPSHAPGQPRTLPPANTKTRLVRPPAIPPLALIARSQHAIPVSPPQSSPEVASLLQLTRFALHQEPESPSPKGRRRLENSSNRHADVVRGFSPKRRGKGHSQGGHWSL